MTQRTALYARVSTSTWLLSRLYATLKCCEGLYDDGSGNGYAPYCKTSCP